MNEWVGFALIALLALAGAGIGLAVYDALARMRAPVPVKREAA